jgi:hypothetical protein
VNVTQIRKSPRKNRTVTPLKLATAKVKRSIQKQQQQQLQNEETDEQANSTQQDSVKDGVKCETTTVKIRLKGRRVSSCSGVLVSRFRHI